MNNLPDIESLKAFLRPYLTPEILTYAGVGLGALIILVILVKLLRKKETPKHFQVAACRECGWHGQVSRWAGVCPQCNKPLGDRKLRGMK